MDFTKNDTEKTIFTLFLVSACVSNVLSGEEILDSRRKINCFQTEPNHLKPNLCYKGHHWKAVPIQQHTNSVEHVKMIDVFDISL